MRKRIIQLGKKIYGSMNEAMIKGQLAMSSVIARPLRRKSGGKEVIIEFVLMVVAVVVGYIFKDQLSSLVTSLGTSVNTKISAMFSN